jgi:hypothetical protein
MSRSHKHVANLRWRRIDGEKCKCGARYELGDTGWLVIHCGHPTANHPYYGESPDGEMIIAGRYAFDTLNDAQDAVEKRAGAAVVDEAAVWMIRNDPPKHRKQKFDNAFNTRQRTLIDGFDCLAGQKDLF